MLGCTKNGFGGISVRRTENKPNDPTKVLFVLELDWERMVMCMPQEKMILPTESGLSC